METVVKIKLINGMDVIGKLYEREITSDVFRSIPSIVLKDPMLVQTRITPDGNVSFGLMPYDPSCPPENNTHEFATHAVASALLSVPVEFEREYLSQVSGILLAR